MGTSDLQQGLRFMNSDWRLPKTLFHIAIYGTTGCLDENTKIWIFKDKISKRKLNELPNSFFVVSYNFKTFKKEIKPAIKLDRGIQECYEIEFENNKKIIVTRNHTFFNSNREEIKVKDLKAGDELFGFKRAPGCMLGTSKTDGTYNLNMGFQPGSIPWSKGKHLDKKKYAKSLELMGRPSKEKWKRISTLEECYGIEKAKSIKMKMSKNHADFKGIKNPFFGKKHTLENCKKSSERAKKQKHSSESNIKRSISVKKNKRHQENTDWQKGNTFEDMYGIKKAKEMKSKMGLKGDKNPSYGKVRYPKLFYSELIGHKVRSSWEEKVCKILQENNIKYKYEPKAFPIIVDGEKHTYTPDIEINDYTYLEIKGPVFYYQLDKMKAFKLQYPDIKLIIITSIQNINKFDFSFADLILDYNKIINKVESINGI